MLWNMWAWRSCALIADVRPKSPDTRKLGIILRRALSGTELRKVELKPTDLVEQLRKLLSDQLDEQFQEPLATVMHLQLVYGERLLHDIDTLLESGLEDGATVDVVKMRRWFAVTSSGDCTAKLWDVENGRCFMTLLGHRGPVLIAKTSPDSRVVATGSQDGTVKLWRVTSGDCILTLGHGQPVISISFSPDGILLACGTTDGNVHVWEAANGESVRIIPMHELAPVYSVDFSPDGRSIMTACGDGGTVQLWNVATGSCDLHLEEQEDVVLCARFSPDGCGILVGFSDDTLQILDAKTGFCTQQLDGHDGAIYSVAFSLDGQHILTSSSDGTAKLWRTKTGDCSRTFSGHYGDVLSAALCPDGILVGTASADHSAQIWSRQSGQCICLLEGHCAPVYSIDFAKS